MKGRRHPPTLLVWVRGRTHEQGMEILEGRHSQFNKMRACAFVMRA